MDKPLSVVLASGGLDSAAAAAMAASDGALALLHANYGQRTEARELKAFHAIAEHYRACERLVIELGHLRRIGGSALTDTSIDVPKGELEREGVPVTYVPFRNAHLLAAAVSWAEVLGAGRVYIGAVEEDSSGYPDCTEPFFSAFAGAVRAGTRPETTIEIKAPLLKMTKGEIVRTAIELGAPLELTWSCYKDEELACGECDSCLLRLKGFRDAGVKDPIAYRGA